MPEGQDQAAGVAAGVSEIMGKAQFDSNEATKQQDDAMPTAGHVFAVLLVQQLLSSLQQASQVLQWQCNELDSLASQLMDLHSTSRPPPTSDQPKTSRSHNQQASLDAAALAEEVAEETLDYDESFSGSEASIPHGPRVFRGGWWEPEPLPVPATFDNAKYQTAQLLGLLIKGRESISLLSDEAVQKTFTQLKAALESSGTGSVLSLSPVVTFWACCCAVPGGIKAVNKSLNLVGLLSHVM